MFDIDGKIRFAFGCDYCGKEVSETHEFDDTDINQSCNVSDYYDRMKVKVKESGWIVGPDEDVCPECRVEESKEPKG